MKHLANSLTLSRMILSLLLILMMNRPILFIITYCLAGLTDVLDGQIARKTNTASELGAKLDSLADMLMYGVIASALIIWTGEGMKSVWPYLCIAIAIRIAALLFAAYRYRTLAMIHTLGNKATGLVVFFAPLMIFSPHYAASAFRIVCIVSSLAAAEELLIHLTSRELDLNRKSFFRSNPTSPD
ncbi:CDP-alcohol phosphatidyltransferase family protein [Paenibacillus phocaensis]|uniref:CDP-alcohol phosphatidyltransferase family protein n=1 Tax=Paenibacillus phocaensis TaxID=1776378 RepID=UPI0003A6482E|nr:CDP-alcohol phosphatidyltransferase family protein [Paenibacillus phocaensis]